MVGFACLPKAAISGSPTSHNDELLPAFNLFSK